MKKWISLLLILVLVLSLAACGKEFGLADLLNCPTDSMENAEAFLKDAGLEIKGTSANSVTFSFGNWDGQIAALGISLSLSQVTARTHNVNYNEEVTAMLKQIEDLCGEPYSTNESSNPMGLDMQSSTSFYKYDGGTIVVDESTIAGTSRMTIVIYPGANT